MIKFDNMDAYRDSDHAQSYDSIMRSYIQSEYIEESSEEMKKPVKGQAQGKNSVKSRDYQEEKQMMFLKKRDLVERYLNANLGAPGYDSKPQSTQPSEPRIGHHDVTARVRQRHLNCTNNQAVSSRHYFNP